MRHRLFVWLVAWVELAESVVTILTFGFVTPEWSFDAVLALLDLESKD